MRESDPTASASSGPTSMLAKLRSIEPEVALATGGVAGLLLVFVLVAGWVADGTTTSIDHQIMVAFRTPGDMADPIGPKWLESAVRDVTALGSTVVLSFLVLSVAVFLWLTGQARTALFVLAGTISGTTLSSLLKLAFARPRPELVPHQVEVYTASFPSGHALMSAVVYLTLGVLVARTQTDTTVRAFIMGLAVFLALAVGLSRVYLGVHWPSDVLAGWCLGGLWATFCWLVARSELATRA